MTDKSRNKTEIILIAAVSENDVIGKRNALPWYLPEDLKHFRRLTLGHTVVMGRKTYQSIGHALPRRRNIVLSNSQFNAPGVEVFSSLEAALAACESALKAFIIGGGQIFKHALPLADTIELTRVHQHIAGDVFFPEINPQDWRVVASDPRDGYTFITYQRISKNP